MVKICSFVFFPLSVYIYFFKLKNIEDVLLVELMYLVFTRMPGESYHR